MIGKDESKGKREREDMKEKEKGGYLVKEGGEVRRRPDRENPLPLR